MSDMILNHLNRRRTFLKSAFGAGGGFALTMMQPTPASAKRSFVDERPNVIGPREGYSPQIGTLVSMMTWMRTTMLYPVKNMKSEELDYLHDENANSIGAMLLHLAATERFYQIHTFEDKKWGDWAEKDKTKYDVAMRLGADARKSIKGKNLEFYLDALDEVRNHTLSEFRKRDDNWLMKVDENWFWGPTNNYCKWFHVCEHESNHNGQIKWIKGRLPGAKGGND
jgi:hypothetical protein